MKRPRTLAPCPGKTRCSTTGFVCVGPRGDASRPRGNESERKSCLPSQEVRYRWYRGTWYGAPTPRPLLPNKQTKFGTLLTDTNNSRAVATKLHYQSARSSAKVPRRQFRDSSPRNLEDVIDHGRRVVPRQLVDAEVPVRVRGDWRSSEVLRDGFVSNAEAHEPCGGQTKTLGLACFFIAGGERKYCSRRRSSKWISVHPSTNHSASMHYLTERERKMNIGLSMDRLHWSDVEVQKGGRGTIDDTTHPSTVIRHASLDREWSTLWE